MSKPDLSCWTHRGGASESRVECFIITEVIFAFHSTSPCLKLTTECVAIPTVHMKRFILVVTNQDCAVRAPITTDISELWKAAESSISFYKQIQAFQWHSPIISIVHPSGRKITGGSPMSGDIPDGPYAEHWQTVVVPFRLILVDRHVVKVEH